MLYEWNNWLSEQTNHLVTNDLVRLHLTTKELIKSTEQTNQEESIKDDKIHCFSTNDYLGLSEHPEVKWAMENHIKNKGIGYRASSSIGGRSEIQKNLEKQLANLKKTENCIIFSSGYACNLSVISSLGIGKDISIFSDELNHASIIDGCRMAVKNSANLYIYKHKDSKHLNSLLSNSNTKRNIVITDSLFSMDGDFANFEDIVTLKQKYRFLLIVDEAHDTLVFGDDGAGYASELKLSNYIDIHIGTLSKAIGVHGGFVCCPENFHIYLKSKCRSLLYSTALPEPIIAASIQSLIISKREKWRQKHLWQLIEYIGRRLDIEVKSQIIPLIIGSTEEANKLEKYLLSKGFYCPVIRPPTVPEGTSRISLNANHTFEELDALIEAIKNSDFRYKTNIISKNINLKISKL